mgnify:FL=1|jgi:hypothetical protein
MNLNGLSGFAMSTIEKAKVACSFDNFLQDIYAPAPDERQIKFKEMVGDGMLHTLRFRNGKAMSMKSAYRTHVVIKPQQHCSGLCNFAMRGNEGFADSDETLVSLVNAESIEKLKVHKAAGERNTVTRKVHFS